MIELVAPPVPDLSEADTNRDFRAIVDQHKRAVYALSFELTGNHHDAEDLSQEVFIKVYRSLDKFRGDSQMFSWIYRITVNTYLNKKSKKALRFRKLTSDFEDVRMDTFVESDDTRSVLLEQHMAKAMEQLSASEKAAFVLRYREDLAVKEVASTMDIAEGTVKSLLHRAIRKLRKSLAFYREELGLSIAEQS